MGYFDILYFTWLFKLWCFSPTEHVTLHMKPKTDFRDLASQNFPYKPHYLGNVLFDGKLVRANANFGCFMTLNTSNVASCEIPDNVRVRLRSDCTSWFLSWCNIIYWLLITTWFCKISRPFAADEHILNTIVFISLADIRGKNIITVWPFQQIIIILSES